MCRAGRIIVSMLLVLNVLNAVGADGSFGNGDSGRSVLAELRRITPAFSLMGLVGAALVSRWAWGLGPGA